MSAFLCDHATIDAILTVSLALDAYEDGSGEPVEARVEAPGIRDWADKLGNQLWRENERSVDYLYTDFGGDRSSYMFRPMPYDDVRVAAVRALGAAGCWRYQSCETPDHASSPAWHFVEAFRERIFDVLDLSSRGYGWEILDQEREYALTSAHLLAEIEYWDSETRTDYRGSMTLTPRNYTR